MKLIDLIKQIKPEQILPLVLITINLCASAVCLKQGDTKKAVYWLAAAVLNVCVTF